ncbi:MULTISPECIES: potassium channel family protein [Thermaerobacter]|uniref:K+ transport system, NAD-binding component n=1 Tax=Thermaerobacter subterraneus DSM 13965 TaxID=867903 RepID=K6PM99_9FIRM|nr:MULTISPECIES: TrkA family potassium uptake protein [Thermaerobacter]EKP93982.1 K+ transport system, NAD-binding component [Thermaerobacter subterraneus DSM 13965]QIA26814.1 TrkA family potassium uptake protein [Thermaerobacter sp. PB12/4term]
MPVREFAVIGLGRFGRAVATTLYEMGFSVLGIDSDEQVVQDMVQHATHVVTADATDEDVLRSLGLRNFDVVVVAIGDLEASVLVTLMLKEMGVRRVVAKAVSEHHGRVLQRIGADRVVFPERDMGIRLAQRMVSAHFLDYIEVSPDISVVELQAGGDMVGKTLEQLRLRNRFRVTVIALRRGDEVIVAPGAGATIQAGDLVVVIGSNENIRRMQEELGL